MIEPAHTHVCLLRGINVSGRRPIRMADLRALFESIGFAGVETYLQSGNVVFQCGRGSESSLASKVKRAIEERFALDVPVIVREKSRFLNVRGLNPLLRVEGIDEVKLHVTFLSHEPAAADLDWLGSLETSPERLAVLGDCVYLYCPNGYGRTKLSNSFLERRLGTAATTRNWRTVNAIHDMLSAR